MKILQNWRQPLSYAVISIRYCHYKFTILYFTIQKLILASNSYLNCSIIPLIILNCYTISMDSNIFTCWSQVRNPAGLRRFPFPHPSLFFRIFCGSSSLFFLDFWWNFWAQMRRERGCRSYIEVGTLSPEGGPVAPLPPPSPAPRSLGDLFVNFFTK